MLPSSSSPSVGDEGVEGTEYAPGLFPLLSRYLVIRSTSPHLVIHPARVVLVVRGAVVSHAPPRLSSSGGDGGDDEIGGDGGGAWQRVGARWWWWWLVVTWP
jgi:hypothetical protein